MKETYRQRLARIIQIEKEGNDKYSRAYDWYMLVIIGLSLIPLMVENDDTPFMKWIEWATVMTFSSFFDALYWSTVTLTTVGYGDLCPVSVCGRSISMISSLFGIGLITAASGAVTSGFIEEIKKREGICDDN